MKKQEIEVQVDDVDFIMFKTTCQCNDNRHSITAIVECNKQDKSFVQTSFYFQVGWRVRFSGNIFQKLFDRIKAACKILFYGYLDLDEEFLFRDDNQLKEFRNTLEEAINQVEQYRKNNI